MLPAVDRVTKPVAGACQYHRPAAGAGQTVRPRANARRGSGNEDDLPFESHADILGYALHLRSKYKLLASGGSDFALPVGGFEEFAGTGAVGGAY